jgi:hypothetical protein
MHKRIRFIAALSAILAVVVAPILAAQALTGVLKKVKDSGEITLGYRDASCRSPTSTTSSSRSATRSICACAWPTP